MACCGGRKLPELGRRLGTGQVVGANILRVRAPQAAGSGHEFLRRPPQPASQTNGPTNAVGGQRLGRSVTRAEASARLSVRQRLEPSSPISVPVRQTI